MKEGDRDVIAVKKQKRCLGMMERVAVERGVVDSKRWLVTRYKGGRKWSRR